MSEDSLSDSEDSVFCGADSKDRFARHAQRALQAENFTYPADEVLVNLAEIELFFQAVEQENKQLVTQILKSNPSILDARSPRRHYASALHVAAENDFADIVATLLEAHADPSLTNEFGLNALALCSPGSKSFALISEVTDMKENGRRDAVLRAGDNFYRF